MSLCAIKHTDYVHVTYSFVVAKKLTLLGNEENISIQNNGTRTRQVPIGLSKIGPVESHSGVRRNILVPLRTTFRGLSGEKCWNIFKWCILVYFIFLSDVRLPNVAGPGVTYPLPPSRRACWESEPKPQKRSRKMLGSRPAAKRPKRIAQRICLFRIFRASAVAKVYIIHFMSTSCTNCCCTSFRSRQLLQQLLSIPAMLLVLMWVIEIAVPLQIQLGLQQIRFCFCNEENEAMRKKSTPSNNEAYPAEPFRRSTHGYSLEWWNAEMWSFFKQYHHCILQASTTNHADILYKVRAGHNA